jgi:3-oxoacyl-[acyl-carrier-protein] synthase II
VSPDVVVTGRGVVSALGAGVEPFWEDLSGGVVGIEDGAAAATTFDPEAWIDPRKARRLDRFTQLAMAAAQQATAEAGLPDGADPARTAVIVGTGVGGLITLEQQSRAFIEGGDRAVSPHFVTMLMPNAAAGAIAMELGATGPGFAVGSACASGAHAIAEAYELVRRGVVDVAVVGGTEAALTPLALAAFRRMGALSPTGQSLPFDARRNGFVMGEGAAILVLERAEHAAARGAKALARIVGAGASNDAFHITMRAALADADASPADVGWVSAHGTGTPYNDKAETVAIRAVFDDAPPPVSSAKAQVGHTLGAAGAIEALIAVEAVSRGLIPPTASYAEPDPECDLDVVPEGVREAPGLELALSNSFGFGGQNACLAVAAA